MSLDPGSGLIRNHTSLVSHYLSLLLSLALSLRQVQADPDQPSGRVHRRRVRRVELQYLLLLLQQGHVQGINFTSLCLWHIYQKHRNADLI